MISFFVAGIPQQQGSSRAFIPKRWKRAVITSDNPKLKGWREVVAGVAQVHRPNELWELGVAVSLIFSMPKPKCIAKKGTKLHTKRPDLDKLIRGVFDALTGIIWKDDSQVFDVNARKEYSDSPGVAVSIDGPVERGYYAKSQEAEV